MARKQRRVPVRLDPEEIQELPVAEIRAILRAADDVVGVGGRNQLVKILKGSKEKKIVERGLDQNPCYGYFRALPVKEVAAKVDWLIDNRYLKIFYEGRLPLLGYTEAGWELEMDIYTDELLGKLAAMADSGDYSYLQSFKDRSRKMMLLLLTKVKQSGDKKFIRPLEEWRKLDYKKVREAIDKVIQRLAK